MMMIICFIFLLLATPIASQTTNGQTRVLYEAFDPPSLNTSIWNYGYPWGSYYNHRANTTPRQAKITQDGFLNITATRERSISLGLQTEFGPIDLDFTSGAVNTNGKLCIKNGFVDISLRAAETPSTWPSVFLVPEDQGTVPMLTIMEVFDSRSRYSYGFKYTNDQGEVQEENGIADERQTSDGIHRYGLDWGYDQITWYYDNKWVSTITKSNELRQVGNMCLVIALGVGGKSKGTAVDPKAYPSIMSIDLLEVWQPKYDGFYKFQNVQTGLLMEIDSALHDWGTRVLQWEDNGGDWQKWHVQYAGHGQYRLIAAHSRLGLDADAWGVSDGTKLLQWSYHSGNNQLWKIQIVDDSSSDVVVQLINIFTLTNSDVGKMISVPADDTSPGVQLHLWHDLNSDLQKWRMIRL
ncbi:unnamed protein product [Didymodactylos carnosus]|uniref:GH16 domain-containing protein n=1 Tax=Didymodactylos carnosus TaxID=1234261 RepID=A0A814SFH2_9BILA|nr:unnamed protein product [Didymodactylos carnosus]CAF1262843.1 unnamed protein product [Didymodactylos carnosus]CAF3910222.1 unnamed protein product [Didymodactylos carnosus]CAF4069327.1 unnamed protein product [Didymodactylos carnosus]